MDRPGWGRLQAAIDAGEVSAVVVWRLDRLGRTAKGLTALFHDLREKKINLVSLRDGLDLARPPAGSWQMSWPRSRNSRPRCGPSGSSRPGRCPRQGQGLGRRQAGPPCAAFRGEGNRDQATQPGRQADCRDRPRRRAVAAHGLPGDWLTRGSIWPGVYFHRPENQRVSRACAASALGEFFGIFLRAQLPATAGKPAKARAKIVVSLGREPRCGRLANRTAAFQAALAISWHPISVPNCAECRQGGVRLLAGHHGVSVAMAGSPCPDIHGRRPVWLWPRALLPLVPWMTFWREPALPCAASLPPRWRANWR